MFPVIFEAAIADDERRAQLYAGAVHITTPTPAATAFCAFARDLIEEGFEGDAETAQFNMPVEDYAAILTELKPRFIHHPRSKELLREVLAERGCDLEQTYFDVPRLRSSTSDGYLTSGIAYAWHPHRDTWYSAPMAQLNFWMPVWDIEPTNAMAFHVDYFDRAVPNTSSGYNYYEWNQKYRRAAAANVQAESRPLPRATDDIDTSNAVVFITPVGGLIEFSGQQMHSSVPNTSGRTRFSIDFRTVHIGDIREGKSARNVDANCTGSSIRDFIRASDFSTMPSDVVSMFDDGTEREGELVYADNRG